MPKKTLIDISPVSNGEGNKGYGGKLEAYSFKDATCSEWFQDFVAEVTSALGKRYLPIYRMADGEMRFLFGLRINWHSSTIRSVARYVKYEILKRPWKTSWNEQYSPEKQQRLQSVLRECMLEIASVGKLAIYWNENGLHAFTEYNRTMEKLLLRLGIRLTADNYVPFHFGQALLANHPEKMIRNRNILIVSGMDDAEFGHLNRELTALGCAHAELYRCSATAALEDDYTKVAPRVKPDVVFVAAGIGAAKVLTGLRHLDCPVIDIGGFIHVLSGKSPSAHSGFFVKPVSSLKTQEA